MSINKIINYAGFISAIITISGSSAIVYIINILKTMGDEEIESKQIFIMLLGLIVMLVIINILLFTLAYQRNKNTKAYKINQYFTNYKSNEGVRYLETYSNELMLKKALDSFNTLIKKETTNTLESDVYYFYLFALLNGATKRIWATSIMGEEEWIDTPEEEEFLRLNLKAQSKKVLVERIFIVKKSDMSSMLSSPPVLKQMSKRNDYLKIYIVLEEELKTKKPNLLTDIGSGFLAFDDFAVAIDVFEDSYIRGILSLDADTIDRYNRIFTNLRDYAKPLDNEYLFSIKENAN